MLSKEGKILEIQQLLMNHDKKQKPTSQQPIITSVSSVDAPFANKITAALNSNVDQMSNCGERVKSETRVEDRSEGRKEEGGKGILYRRDWHINKFTKRVPIIE